MLTTPLGSTHLILVDGTPLRRDSKGVGRYTYHLCCQLDQKLPQEWQLAIVTFNWPLPDFPSDFRGQFISIPYKTDLSLGLWYFPKIIHKLQPSVFLRCRESIGLRYSVPTITVCHDLNEILWSFQPPRSPIRYIFDGLCQKLRVYALRQSMLVICNSAFVQDQASQTYNIPLDKIKIGYCGVDPRFYDLSPRVNQGQVCRHYGFGGFLLAFATGDYRENFTTLPFLFAKLKQQGYPGSLVIAGVNQYASYAQALIQALKDQNLQFNHDYYIEPFLGEDQFADLVNLYTSADFYLELSWHEGFGMQLAEAMACGTTCVSSQRAALKEVGGSWVIPIDPSNPDQACDIIYAAWKNNLHKRDNSKQVEYIQNSFNWKAVGHILTETILTNLA